MSTNRPSSKVTYQSSLKVQVPGMFKNYLLNVKDT